VGHTHCHAPAPVSVHLIEFQAKDISRDALPKALSEGGNPT
jgi:hypothetical protein